MSDLARAASQLPTRCEVAMICSDPRVAADYADQLAGSGLRTELWCWYPDDRAWTQDNDPDEEPLFWAAIFPDWEPGEESG